MKIFEKRFATRKWLDYEGKLVCQNNFFQKISRKTYNPKSIVNSFHELIWNFEINSTNFTLKITTYYLNSIEKSLLKFDWNSTACACDPTQMVEL